MHLPILHPLLNDQSTYVTFTPSHLDLDFAQNHKTPYYFSKMIAIELPQYTVGGFTFQDKLDEHATITEVFDKLNANTMFPKCIQYYMENIIRNYSPDFKESYKYRTELAFYKLLNLGGMSSEQIKSSIKYVNKIVSSTFVETENNNGWSEVICVIPNSAKKQIIEFKKIEDVPNILQSTEPNNSNDAKYDNGNKQFEFAEDFKSIINFDNYDNFNIDSNSKDSFSFNALLIFYRDKDNVDKLHGIYFPNPYENKVSVQELPIFTKKYNDARSVGFIFKFNLKTVHNTSNNILVQHQNDYYWSLNQLETFSKLQSFLENKVNWKIKD